MKRLPIILAALLCGGAYAQTEPLTQIGRAHV